jgi:hypothetical protein
MIGRLSSLDSSEGNKNKRFWRPHYTITYKVDVIHVPFQGAVRWPQLSEQYFRVDKWSLCQG